MSDVGTLLDLRIEKPAAGGRMIARHAGRIVLVAGAIPGEHVRARVEHALRDVWLASVVEVIEPHPARRSENPDPACGGMTYAHIAYDEQRALKAAIVADQFARLGRLTLPAPVPVHASPTEAYRMRMRVHFRHGRLGAFREGTHEICDVGLTGQLLPETVDVLRHVGETFSRGGVSQVASIEVMENLSGTQRALHVDEDDAAPVATRVLQQCADTAALTGVSRSSRRQPRTQIVSGQPWVADPLSAFAAASGVPDDAAGAPRLRRHVRAFFQANRMLTPALVRAVVVRLPAHHVVDLYAGVGLFALSAAARGVERVMAVEGDEVTGGDLVANARPFGEQVRVIRASVESFLARVPDVREATMIVDPPRTGISKVAIQRLIASRPARLVYVSCDVATLARDVRRLVDAGYGLESVEAFDLFPNTPHIESLVVLTRS